MKKEKRFEIVYQEGSFMSAKTIYVDKETGVNYLSLYRQRICGRIDAAAGCRGETRRHQRNGRLRRSRFLVRREAAL